MPRHAEGFHRVSVAIPILAIATGIAFTAMNGATSSRIAPTARPESVLDFTMKDIDGRDVPLSTYKGKVLLIVNVASQCGYTPQYAGLEELYRRYSGRGLVILGFPANNFGAQEPGTDAEIKEFCSSRYHVTFPIFSKISVKGSDQHPLYQFITSDPRVGGEVRWNFQKYLVDRKGALVSRFASRVEPLSEELTKAIEAALQ